VNPTRGAPRATSGRATAALPGPVNLECVP